MKYKATSAFSLCGFVFQPDASGLVEVPESVASRPEFHDFVERNARDIAAVKAAPAKGDE